MTRTSLTVTLCRGGPRSTSGIIPQADTLFYRRSLTGLQLATRLGCQPQNPGMCLFPTQVHTRRQAGRQAHTRTDAGLFHMYSGD